MKICDEMIKLRDKLDKRGIKWKDVSEITPESVIKKMVEKGLDRKFADTTIFRTHFEHDNYKYSVIYGFGTYGGVDVLSGHDFGMLECMTEKINGGEPLGNLTAKDVLDIIDGTYKEREQNAD